MRLWCPLKIQKPRSRQWDKDFPTETEKIEDRLLELKKSLGNFLRVYSATVAIWPLCVFRSEFNRSSLLGQQA